MPTINPNDKQSNNRIIQEKRKEIQISPIRRKSVSFTIPDGTMPDTRTLKSMTSLKSKVDKTDKGYDNQTIILSTTTKVKLRKTKEKLFNYKIMIKIWGQHVEYQLKDQLEVFADKINKDLSDCSDKFQALERVGLTDNNALDIIKNNVKEIANNLDEPYQALQSIISENDGILDIQEKCISNAIQNMRKKRHAQKSKRKISTDSSLEQNKQQATMHAVKTHNDDDKKPAAKKSPPSK